MKLMRLLSLEFQNSKLEDNNVLKFLTIKKQ